MIIKMIIKVFYQKVTPRSRINQLLKIFNYSYIYSFKIGLFFSWQLVNLQKYSGISLHLTEIKDPRIKAGSDNLERQ